MRVTIVATGFDASKLESNITNVDTDAMVNQTINQSHNYNVNQITSSNIQETVNTEEVQDISKEVIADNDIDNIDVPAFLRQQAD